MLYRSQREKHLWNYHRCGTKWELALTLWETHERMHTDTHSVCGVNWEAVRPVAWSFENVSSEVLLRWQQLSIHTRVRPPASFLPLSLSASRLPHSDPLETKDLSVYSINPPSHTAIYLVCAFDLVLQRSYGRADFGASRDGANCRRIN